MYLLKGKDQKLDALKEFQARVKHETSQKIKSVLFHSIIPNIIKWPLYRCGFGSGMYLTSLFSNHIIEQIYAIRRESEKPQ